MQRSGIIAAVVITQQLVAGAWGPPIDDIFNLILASCVQI